MKSIFLIFPSYFSQFSCHQSFHFISQFPFTPSFNFLRLTIIIWPISLLFTFNNFHLVILFFLLQFMSSQSFYLFFLHTSTISIYSFNLFTFFCNFLLVSLVTFFYNFHLVNLFTFSLSFTISIQSYLSTFTPLTVAFTKK